MSSNKMREVISEQFNQQQLIIAKSVASDIEEKYEFIRNELHTLNLSPAIQYLEVSWPNRMQITMENVKPYGVVEIGLVEAKGQEGIIYRLDSQGKQQITRVDIDAGAVFPMVLKIPATRISFLLNAPPWIFNDDSQKPYLLVAMPTYKVSVDESHPQALGNFSGCLYFLVDPVLLAKKYTKDIRSGQTGYAWVIDAEETFLYHPEQDFIGKNAFEITRKEEREGLF